MPVSIVVPQMGESVVEGTVGRWLKAEGDQVQKDETVVEIMTDKVNVEIPAISAGTLGKILVPEGTVVGIGTEIGVILAPGEALSGDGGQKSAPAAQPATKAAAGEAQAMGQPMTAAATVTTTSPTPPAVTITRPGESAEEKRSSPVVRRLLREHNLTLDEIPGSGGGGRVTKEDVLNFVRTQKSTPSRPVAAPAAASRQTAAAPSPFTLPAVQGTETVERLPLVGVRKLIADHMVKSKQTSPHVMTMDEVDLSELVRMRDRDKEKWSELAGANVTYLPFFIKSAVAALREFPAVNASIDGETIVYKKYYHIGIAVARDEGLIVPVIKFADQKSIIQLAREAADLADRARNNQLKPDEVAGSTFTLTNAGMYGALASTPVINQPEVAILGMHMIQKRPVVRDNDIVIRNMMYLTISFDHRLIDGHIAVQFLRNVCRRLENPYELMMTI
jgi:2-oxoglutarate dehydrogenase E2 component (dihydrolipoamide succinyltransferase)